MTDAQMDEIGRLLDRLIDLQEDHIIAVSRTNEQLARLIELEERKEKNGD